MSQTSGSAAPTRNFSSKHEAARSQIESLLQRQKDKEAYSQAKGLFRLDTSPETRRLLERAYLLRIESLVRSGQMGPAREIALAWLGLGVQEAALVEPLIAILPRLGMGDRIAELSQRLGQSDDGAKIAEVLCDQLVLFPDAANPQAAAHGETARKIRAALTAILAGDLGAVVGLDDIPRQSPLSDWKLLARGLVAFQRGDENGAGANWSRLQPSRVAGKIAAVLQKRLIRIEPKSESGAAGGSLGELRLRRDGANQPLMQHFDVVHDAYENDDLKRFLYALEQTYRALKQYAPALGERLTAAAIPPLIDMAVSRSQREGLAAIEAFTRFAQPMALDPRWNRLRALAWMEAMGTEYGGIIHWEAYVADVATLTQLPEEHRRLLGGMVWEKIGDGHVAIDRHADAIGRSKKAQHQETLRLASEAFERCVQLRPTHVAPYLKMAEIAAQDKSHKKLAGTLQRVLDTFPQNPDAAQKVFELAKKRELASLMLAASTILRRLKPLAQEFVVLEIAARHALVRHVAIQHQWDDARRELQAIESLCSTSNQRMLVAARRIVLEYKAGNEAGARALEEQTLSQAEDRVGVQFALAVESIRFGLAQPIPKLLRANFEREIKKGKKFGSRAAALARILIDESQTDLSSDRYRPLCRPAWDYLSKSWKAEFSEDALEIVLKALESGPLPVGYQRLAKRGTTLFPESALMHFHFAKASLYECLNLRKINLYRAVRHLNRALELAGSPESRHAALLPEMREFRTSELEPAQLAQDQELFSMFRRFMHERDGEDDESPSSFGEGDDFDGIPF